MEIKSTDLLPPKHLDKTKKCCLPGLSRAFSREALNPNTARNHPFQIGSVILAHLIHVHRDGAWPTTPSCWKYILTWPPGPHPLLVLF